MIHCGNLFDVLPTLPEHSIESCVTDPPYELSFMGKHWDGAGVAFGIQTWQEIHRVLKPGAHLIAFGGTRTYHRMVCAIEDAGFEIRDQLAWIYGSGFPKSLNLGGGLSTALKPAHEPIVLARKPFKGTVAQNVLTHGTGAINIAATRIRYRDDADLALTQLKNPGRNGELVTSDVYGANRPQQQVNELGRWPGNVILGCCGQDPHDPGCAVALLDAQSGQSVSIGGTGQASKQQGGLHGWTPSNTGGFGDTGGASRFFYIAKPSREERDYGCWDLPARSGGEATDRVDGSAGVNSPRAGAGRTGGSRNVHPTVKPVELMRYLVRLVCPPNGTVLDPFAGSGTTGMACRYELREFIGIEREAEYVAIAERRIANCVPLFGDG